MYTARESEEREAEQVSLGMDSQTSIWGGI